MRNSLELRGIPPIKRTVEENLDPGVQSVRDLTGKLSCSIAVSDQKPSNHTFVVDSEYSPVCLNNRYKIMRAGERRYIYIYIVRYRTQEISCFNITLASFPISVFLNFLLSYSLLLII